MDNTEKQFLDDSNTYLSYQRNVKAANCRHPTVNAFVYYDILNGFTIIRNQCLKCGKITKLTIYATTKTKEEIETP